MVSIAGPKRTTLPRRSSASTLKGKIVSSAEVAAGARAGISMWGSDMMTLYDSIYSVDLDNWLASSFASATAALSAVSRRDGATSSPPPLAGEGVDRLCRPLCAYSVRLNSAPVQAPGQNAFLRMQAVLGLVEHDRLRPVDHLVRDLLAAVRRQAMHEHRARIRPRHQPGIDFIALEQVVAAVGAPRPPPKPAIRRPRHSAP